VRVVQGQKKQRNNKERNSCYPVVGESVVIFERRKVLNQNATGTRRVELMKEVFKGRMVNAFQHFGIFQI